MLISEAYLYVPELFVKVLNPETVFDIFILTDSDLEQPQLDISKHILICREADLSQIGLPEFIRYLDIYKFGYPYSYIVIREEVMATFVNSPNALK